MAKTENQTELNAPRPKGKKGRKPLPPGQRLVTLTSNVRPRVKFFYDSLADFLKGKLGHEVGVAALTHEALEHAIEFMEERYGVTFYVKGRTLGVKESPGAAKRERDPETGALQE